MDVGKVVDNVLRSEPAYEVSNNLVYDVGAGVVAKVFADPWLRLGRSEFRNLRRIRDLNDERLTVPCPVDLLDLGYNHDLIEAGDPSSHLRIMLEVSYGMEGLVYPVQAVLMEKLEGTSLPQVELDRRGDYQQRLVDLVEGLIERGVRILDLKPDEIILYLF